MAWLGAVTAPAPMLGPPADTDAFQPPTGAIVRDAAGLVGEGETDGEGAAATEGVQPGAAQG
ncbi:MAG: hypothetical protein ACKO45_14890 [Cyanobium sp.]